jgi:hypothetical protein
MVMGYERKKTVDDKQNNLQFNDVKLLKML